MNISKLRAIGGSVAVTLPRPLLRQMGLEAGHEVEITSDGHSLNLSPRRKHYALAVLLKGMKPGDMPTAEGWDTAQPAGREAW
jgi:antitoxin ChpS